MTENLPSSRCLKEKLCPCRAWIQCHMYVDRNIQAQRLKRKEYGMIEWYQDNFRIDYKIADVFGNG